MKRLSSVFGIAVILVFVVSLRAGWGQSSTPPADTTLSGELVKVDVAAKVISVKDLDGKEFNFNYSDATKMTNPEASTKDLAAKTGSRLIVTYREEKGAKWATEILFTE